jgi:hypothetical protein
MFFYGLFAFDLGANLDASLLIYDIALLSWAWVGLVMAVAFMRYGYLLCSMLLAANASDKIVQSHCRKIVVISILCGLSFIVRCVTLAYRPITGQVWQGVWGEILYPAFFYPIPELVPAFTMLYLLSVKSSSRSLSNTYATPLLGGEDVAQTKAATFTTASSLFYCEDSSAPKVETETSEW